MNERIKELMKQANLDDDMFPLDDGWENPELITFAELIVRECAGICEARSDPLGYANLTSEANAKAIKQHFGVEE